VSKERAKRRAERLAVLEKEKAARARRVARRDRRRAVLRRLRPGRRSSSGQLRRRSRAQRIGIIVVPLIAAALIWFLVPDLSLRILLTVFIVLVLPAVVVLVLGRARP
jgi:Flp pilus assembly protein TadB